MKIATIKLNSVLRTPSAYNSAYNSTADQLALPSLASAGQITGNIFDYLKTHPWFDALASVLGGGVVAIIGGVGRSRISTRENARPVHHYASSNYMPIKKSISQVEARSIQEKSSSIGKKLTNGFKHLGRKLIVDPFVRVANKARSIVVSVADKVHKNQFLQSATESIADRSVLEPV
jgi:hypothetical protein